MAPSQDPAARLPPEIFEKILADDVLHTEPIDPSATSVSLTKKHMHACVLVKRPWRELCLPFLFKSLDVRLPHETLHPAAFLRFLDQNPHLAKLVKSLAFRTSRKGNDVDNCEISTIMLARILSKLPKIQFLCLSSIDITLEEDEPPIQSQLPVDIARLELDEVRQDLLAPSHLPNLLSIFGAIRVLYLAESPSVRGLLTASQHDRSGQLPPERTKILSLEGDLFTNAEPFPILAFSSLGVLKSTTKLVAVDFEMPNSPILSSVINQDMSRTLTDISLINVYWADDDGMSRTTPLIASNL